jgi:hypothetical protein
MEGGDPIQIETGNSRRLNAMQRIWADGGVAAVHRRRPLLKIALVLLLPYPLLFVGFYIAMCQSPVDFSGIMSRTSNVAFLIFPLKRMWLSAKEGSLKAGDAAPDFSLETYDRKSKSGPENAVQSLIRPDNIGTRGGTVPGAVATGRRRRERFDGRPVATAPGTVPMLLGLI